MSLEAEFVPVNAKMRNCFPSLVKFGKKKWIIYFQRYKWISSKFSNASIFISELIVLLRRHLGKKVWQRLSFLGSTKYEKCGANAHSVSLQNYSSPKHYRPISQIKNSSNSLVSGAYPARLLSTHTRGISAVTGHACSAPGGHPAARQCLLAFRWKIHPAISSVLLHRKLLTAISKEFPAEEEWCYQRTPD